MPDPEHLLMDLRQDSTPLALLRVRQVLRAQAVGTWLEVWLGTDRQARDLERVALGCGDGCRLELDPAGHYRLMLRRGHRSPGGGGCRCG